MAEEAPVKLIQIGPKGGPKKDGFNLVTERVVAVNPEARQLEVELLAYDGKTVVLDVGEEALEDFLKIKPGDGATIRVVEEGGKRIAKSFRIRAKDPNAAKADAMLIDLKDSHWLNRKYAAEVLGELKDSRAVTPLVEVCGRLLSHKHPIFRDALRPYFRDVLDHVTRIDESLDNLRDMENSATQTNLSLITLAESEVTKKLAGWGAILMVPSIVGTIYGMNFKHMPELEWAYGYPAALVLMAVGGAALWAFFRKIQWV